MKELACRACRDCPGIVLRVLWAHGWRPSDRGGWEMRLPHNVGVTIAKQIHAGKTSKRLRVETTAKGTTYYLEMGED